ncbi:MULTISPECIES: hypothetical protein [unclassified Exiguobacterium]|uniref:hypothetical protein n=1 Tax=unclassified Exiguobacterium TaxID=2644629 RepID=UPI0020375292|nr:MULTISPECIES: hypothetical protein [unclassified Exiguobacterium]
MSMIYSGDTRFNHQSFTKKKHNGEWVKLERLPVYTILEVEMNDQTIEAVAIDAFKAITVCRDETSIEAARPYAVRIQIERP